MLGVRKRIVGRCWEKNCGGRVVMMTDRENEVERKGGKRVVLTFVGLMWYI